MAYQAFYRVYRPQSFAEMTGQSHVKKTLQNALLYDKTTHAYLFSGPRGTGKTSAAKIFAKALNCERAPISEPCNECASCLSIMEGSNTDVIEFDAASNSRVEEMREIIEKVRFSPANSRFKVYIIDEVHMLSNSAFNALLKTLEEPPAHAVFILATTEPHKLPLTIISRCQRFDFKRLTQADIVERMKEVLEDAKIPYDEQVLKVIAQAAAGGMRDALSLLDQVVSFSGDQMTVEEALLVTGSISQDMFYRIAEALLAKDIGEALSLLDQLVRDGKDPVRLVEDFVTFFRDMLLIKTAPSLGDMLELASAEPRFEELSQAFEARTLYDWIDVLTKTQQEMRFSNHTKIYMETALLKMVQSEPAVQAVAQAAPELEAKITALEKVVRDLQAQLKNGVAASPAEPAAEANRPRQRPQGRFKVPAGRIQEVLKHATKEDINAIKTNWASVLSQLQRSHAALLNDAEPVAASKDAFVLKFKYDIHCQMASDNQTFAAAFSQLLQQYTGKDYEPVFVPDDNWLKIREDFIKSNGLKQNADEKQESDAEQPFGTEAAAEEDPFIAEAERLFGKEFVEVHDD